MSAAVAEVGCPPAQQVTARLRAVWGTLGGAAPSPVPGSGAQLLAELLARVARTRQLDEAWLALVGLTGSFPHTEDVRDLLRRLRVDTVANTLQWLLDRAHRWARDADTFGRDIQIVVGKTLVDVDFCARHDLNTGIQRVVRATVPRWIRDGCDVQLVAWTPLVCAYRPLQADETRRVVDWASRDSWHEQPTTVRAGPLVVPWRSTVVLAEVPTGPAVGRLAAIAEVSGNRVAAVGYDCIPVVSADMLSLAAPDAFTSYLALLKHTHVVAAISHAAAEEFRGFTDMLPTQGLTGPVVRACPLPLDIPAPPVPPPPAAPGADPVILVVGSHDARKNHLAILHSAEVLWRQGHRFTCEFIGSGQVAQFDLAIAKLKAKRRPVLDSRGASDTYLWQAYRRAAFTVFPSLHEGYGLPVVESVVSGTPAIATEYGSLGEVARELGGVLTIDPRSDGALVAAMRELLTDPDRRRAVISSAHGRPRRTWDDYSVALWTQLHAEDPRRRADAPTRRQDRA